MEDSSISSRRSRPLPPRPESSASSQTRMTPSSSTNGSSVNLPRNQSLSRGASGASLLQERLRERKGENMMARRRSVDIGDKAFSSSPMKGREERRPSSSGTGKPMGARQMEEHVSRLTKHNFNLKLELHHRRERQQALEARLEAAETQIAEQAELQEINDQLLSELEKRDQAVEEAVSVIVGLEDRIERLMKEREIVRSFDAKPHQNHLSSVYDGSFNTPVPTWSKISNAIVRMPSFLSEQSEGTEALRSLYLSTENSYSDLTPPKQSEGGPPTEMDSPRLSVLSEGSFLSIYGERHLSLDNDDAETEPETRKLKADSVERWIDERPASIRTSPPLKPTTTTPRRSDSQRGQFLSINRVLESPSQRLEKLKSTMERNGQLASASTSLASPQNLRDMPKRVMTDTTNFDHHKLPPTPDTVGTDTLRHYQNSNDTLDQTRMIEGTFLNSSSTIPTPGSTNSAFQSTLSVRPRSAGETITSRREGHGWDTETQGDDLSSIASTFATQDSRRPGRALTPDLFTSGSDDRYTSWGRDMMFNHEPGLPSHTAARYEKLRRASTMMHPKSDDTVRHGQNNFNPRDPITPLETTPRPAPPDRRSSLSVTAKIRKSSFAHSPITAIGSSPTMSSQDPKRNRLASRLFGRSDSSPVSVTSMNQASKAHDRKPVWVGNRQENGEDLERATPPPIKRNRNPPPSVYQPSSAGVGTPNFAQRRQYTFGDEIEDGKSFPHAGIEDISPEPEVKRNWLGFGKAGSLRRN